MPVSLQLKASSHLPPPVPTDHCGDRVWQPALRDRRSECPVHLKPLKLPTFHHIINLLLPTELKRAGHTLLILPPLSFFSLLLQQDTREYEVSIWEASQQKDISEPRPTAPSRLFILSSLLLRPGGGNVNTKIDDVQPLLPRDAAIDPVLSSFSASERQDRERKTQSRRGGRRVSVEELSGSVSLGDDGRWRTEGNRPRDHLRKETLGVKTEVKEGRRGRSRGQDTAREDWSSF